MVWKITFTTLGDLPLNITIFIMHMRNGSYANAFSTCLYAIEFEHNIMLAALTLLLPFMTINICIL